ncbi:hypothetical protein K458DRAFT_384943 [Lentithecium fluviatile CBS 122367]|uniref:Uncharacterized protein n=1 Tax=Lentithecium fluviatile CBS 122367 TaxID=1168545 RepID=A0A6G1JF59_9PLEO|nr:hypothetical protein K458DRAFT_384943 [Lentithecium fluviatile CBS 122367]
MADQIFNITIVRVQDFGAYLYDALYTLFRMAANQCMALNFRLYCLVVNTRAEYGPLHPMGQYITLGVITAIVSLTIAFNKGFLADLKDGCALVMRRGGQAPPSALVEAEDHAGGQDDNEDEDGIPRGRVDMRAASEPAIRNKRFFSRTHLSSTNNNEFNIVAPEMNPFSSSTEHRTGRPSHPGYQTPYASANAKAFGANCTATLSNAVLRRESPFRIDTTFSRGARMPSFGAKKEDWAGEGRLESLALDQAARGQLKERAFARTNKDRDL